MGLDDRTLDPRPTFWRGGGGASVLSLVERPISIIRAAIYFVWSRSKQPSGVSVVSGGTLPAYFSEGPAWDKDPGAFVIFGKKIKRGRERPSGARPDGSAIPIFWKPCCASLVKASLSRHLSQKGWDFADFLIQNFLSIFFKSFVFFSELIWMFRDSHVAQTKILIMRFYMP